MGATHRIDGDFVDASELNDDRTHNAVNELTARDTDDNGTDNYSFSYDAAGKLILSTPYYLIQHDLRRGGAIEKISLTHGKVPNLLLQPMESTIRLKMETSPVPAPAPPPAPATKPAASNWPGWQPACPIKTSAAA